jgi:hypothetical protein
MQLYSVEQAKSQPLEAHAAAFSSVKFTGRDLPSNVISFAQKTLKDGQVLSKLHVIELGNAPGACARYAQHGAWGAGRSRCQGRRRRGREPDAAGFATAVQTKEAACRAFESNSWNGGAGMPVLNRSA